ncbi:MAG TPA: four helix bundle protein [Salinimicrobium sp.]|nr:four helix bundle protein [Salinimicrobium sp.]
MINKQLSIMKENVLAEKSYKLAVQVVQLYKEIVKEKREYILSKQFLRCGTSIGANVVEANGGISVADFSAKISIAYKESLETKFWLRLLKDTDYIDLDNFNSLFSQTDELSRILFSILKTTRINKQ